MSKSEDSRGSSISSEVELETQKVGHRKSKESTVTEERGVDRRLSEAIEEENAFLHYIESLPGMSEERVSAYKKGQFKRSTSEVGTGRGLEHLDNLYILMEHLGQLKVQNSKLQERVKYLENIAQEDINANQDVDREADILESKYRSKSKRNTRCKSSHYGMRQSSTKNSRVRSRSVGVEEILKSTSNYPFAAAREVEKRSAGVKAKVSKWAKVKEAFRWEKASTGVLTETKSQDSGLGGGDDVRYLRVPHCRSLSDNSSVSVSPADSVLSAMPNVSSSASTSEEDLADRHRGNSTYRNPILCTNKH